MDKLKKLLDALDQPTLDDEAAAQEPEEPPSPNVVRLRFPSLEDRTAPFTAAERERIRDMLDAFEKIAHTCPIASRAVKKPT